MKVFKQTALPSLADLLPANVYTHQVWISNEWVQYGVPQDEPDFWRGMVGHYHAVINRHTELGQLNGYVKIPENHPGYHLECSHEFWEDIDVHGGLTYSDELYMWNFQKPLPGWYIGFDTGHYKDLAPYQVKINQESSYKFGKYLMEHAVYRDFEYVLAEVQGLVHQVKGLEK